MGRKRTKLTLTAAKLVCNRRLGEDLFEDSQRKGLFQNPVRDVLEKLPHHRMTRAAGSEHKTLGQDWKRFPDHLIQLHAVHGRHEEVADHEIKARLLGDDV